MTDTPRHVRAQDFGITTPGYSFGLNADQVAAALRRLADNVVAGVVAAQGVTVSSTATYEEFHFTTLTFKYTEKLLP